MSDLNPKQDKVQVTDSLGRVITIRKLNAFDRMRIFEVLGASLTENAGYLGYALSAAAVTAVDADPMPFPRAKATLEATVQRLGDEGIEAVTKGYRDNFSPPSDEGDLEAIKN